MKKTLTLLLAVLLAISVLAGCGSSKSDSGTTYNAAYSATYEPAGDGDDYYGEAYAPAPPMEPRPDVYEDSAYDMDAELSASLLGLQNTSAGMSDKIIYTISAYIETVDFDTTISKVYELLDGYGAFIASSDIGGKSYRQAYYGNQTYRNAWFTIRVPAEALSAMTDELSNLGSVTGVNRSSENITAQYIDTESRLKSYRTQEERLFAMMEKAETVEDMLTIEGYLANVRYEIEAMTSQLKNWQNHVDYSTLTLNISEVEKLSELAPTLPLTYWQQIENGLGSTLRGIGNFFKDLLKWVLVNSPVLAILAVIIVVVVLLTIRKRRSIRLKRMADDTANTDTQKKPE